MAWRLLIAFLVFSPAFVMGQDRFVDERNRPETAEAERPNILLVMVDDLGFADLGCYGSEIETPTLDRLAAEGLRFSRFYNTAKCHSSRVALLTGLYCHQAGNESLSRGATIAQVLGSAGYRTSMTGKWHLEGQPTDFGFEHYWGHLSGATDFFHGDDTFRFDGEVWEDFDEDFYTTDANVNWSIAFLREAIDKGEPFFHYIAFNAPHYPLQAPKETIEKYLGRYDQGWDVLRERRFAKQQDLGLFSKDAELPPRPDHVPAWSSLTDKERSMESFRMAVYAAMVDEIDRNMSRLIRFLENTGQRENTLILFCSDNGACPFERSTNIDVPPWEGGSYYLYDASWATVSNTPLRHYKQTQHEGGISTPLIVNWPGELANEGSWVRAPGHLIDIMATCIDTASAPYPASIDGRSIEPLQGLSLLPLFNGESREGHDWLYFQFKDCRALMEDNWKIVSFYGHQWELYNLEEDRAEQHDLAEKHPNQVVAMARIWHQVAETIDRAPEAERQPVKPYPATEPHPEWRRPEMTAGWTMPDFD